ncbi:MAG: hypothetical protein GXO26_08745 [Crenarchaeota archaeon]|nr:hypothetical protein [Thermoproteota archaeon]
MYIRITEDADLLELSRDYMRCSEELPYSFDYYLARLVHQLSPIVMRIVGETQSGGFMTSMIIDTMVSSDTEDFNALGILLLSIIRGYSNAKKKGYLRMDGVVESIREPYKEYRVTIQPIERPSYGDVRVRFDNYLSTIYVEGSLSAINRIREALVCTRKIEHRPVFNVHVFDNERECRDWSMYLGCKKKPDYRVYVYGLPYRAHVMLIPDTEPPARVRNSYADFFTPCQCTKSKVGWNKWIYAVIYPDELEEIIRKSGLPLDSLKNVS